MNTCLLIIFTCILYYSRYDRNLHIPTLKVKSMTSRFSRNSRNIYPPPIMVPLAGISQTDWLEINLFQSKLEPRAWCSSELPISSFSSGNHQSMFDRFHHPWFYLGLTDTWNHSWNQSNCEQIGCWCHRVFSLSTIGFDIGWTNCLRIYFSKYQTPITGLLISL